MSPRVSIGLPVYNGEDFLRPALESLADQTFRDFELIISDNASTDQTQVICTEFAQHDPRTRYYRNETNLGAGKNFNRVFELARGAYFKWAASDDTCAPEFLERCVAVLDTHPDVVLAYPHSQLIDENGAVQGEYRDRLHLQEEKPYQRFRHFFRQQGLCHALFGVIRTGTLQRTGLTGNYPMSDRVLLGELSLYGKFYEIPEKLFYRRVHSGMASKTQTDDQDLAAWFDPAQKGRIVLPKWRRLGEYMKAIFRTPLPVSERMLCLWQIGLFALQPERWSGLGQDLRRATRTLLKQARNDNRARH